MGAVPGGAPPVPELHWAEGEEEEEENGVGHGRHNGKVGGAILGTGGLLDD